MKRSIVIIPTIQHDKNARNIPTFSCVDTFIKHHKDEYDTLLAR
jgi:hypothetical protein